MRRGCFYLIRGIFLCRCLNSWENSSLFSVYLAVPMVLFACGPLVNSGVSKRTAYTKLVYGLWWQTIISIIFIRAVKTRRSFIRTWTLTKLPRFYLKKKIQYFRWDSSFGTTSPTNSDEWNIRYLHAALFFPLLIPFLWINDTQFVFEGVTNWHL